ncbi:MAG: hypothetical protein IPH20_26085 [Bacteroidales bacterium]|nr:hypothetical protein [Bacteroidales bacterium]
MLFLSTSGAGAANCTLKSHADSRPPVNGVLPYRRGLFILLIMAAGLWNEKNPDARNGIEEDVSSE